MAEATSEALKEEVTTLQKANTTMHANFTAEAAALREASAAAERAMNDAEYNAEATAKRLADAVNAERTAHSRTKNEGDQVQLRLRRDLQAAREAAESYHTKQVIGDMSLKLEKERSGETRREMHSALQAVDIMSQERDLAELRVEEIEWSAEMRHNKLVTEKVRQSHDHKEAMAKQAVARKFAEDQASLAASRARQAEDELVELQGELTSAMAETKTLNGERQEALSMLAEQRDRTSKMEQEQELLIGYTDSIAAQAGMGSPYGGPPPPMMMGSQYGSPMGSMGPMSPRMMSSVM
jgi:hypothetical protein